ncbi:MAG: DNA-3-methyladenine glycosylase I [Deltaproteobacteria bacterium]|nr:DNA-3-methyladenine glycosylase I [Deltaproteobacteria bacterium]
MTSSLSVPTDPGKEENDLHLGNDQKTRCRWAVSGIYQVYHDEEWGLPSFDDEVLFEKLCLEGFQAGLSWITVLKKRARFREVFYDFNVEKVAAMTEGDVERLLKDAEIIRHRGKINAAIHNAKQVLELQKKQSLASFLWSFAPPLIDEVPEQLSDFPAVTESSTRLSKSLKRRGFKFVGPTTLYAMMQAMGMVNDHLVGCCRREVLQQEQRRFRKEHQIS